MASLLQVRDHVSECPKWANRRGIRQRRSGPEATRREFDIDLTWEEYLANHNNIMIIIIEAAYRQAGGR